ncbi:dihydroxyacetone kinase phosphoryl donor subunit DhaM [Ktedonospora formicarum]|uniref:phosphoenolpyruvate--glycerone phosphotransferase n=1 Tax=Ktedonospora formicarum TaxID=2778364 RepID=A0A8J3IDM5_9CHLR|nr:dihydroxyacetone kinase phosphoryl donor subunit DhaM [Ktedonospora formicarum]GHO50104.1 PTS mannose transporter subunit IID [Ktedonospora formicarum]
MRAQVRREALAEVSMMSVGLVIVSHSARLAEGVVELADQMAQGKVSMVAAGGALDGSLGTSVERILDALHRVEGHDGVLVLLDLGSAAMSVEMAVEAYQAEKNSRRVVVSSAALVEGAVIAAVEASIGHDLDEVAAAAAEAHTLPKTN